MIIELDSDHFKISAKTGEGINVLFKKIGQKLNLGDINIKEK